MAISVNELMESRRIETGPNPTAELQYVITGTADEIAARDALAMATATTYAVDGVTLYVESIRLTPHTIIEQSPDRCVYFGTLFYSTYYLEAGASTYQFETGGSNEKRMYSLGTRRFGAVAGTAPDFHGAINVTGNAGNLSVEGIDVIVPTFRFSETHYFYDYQVTAGYKAALMAVTGHINSVGWRGYNAGEVLFVGAEGGKTGGRPWEISFHFAATPNATISIPGIENAMDKLGWEYLWIRYEDSGDDPSKQLVKKPVAAYLEQVYPIAPFSLLGIGL